MRIKRWWYYTKQLLRFNADRKKLIILRGMHKQAIDKYNTLYRQEPLKSVEAKGEMIMIDKILKLW